jgi:hypothetical protein
VRTRQRADQHDLPVQGLAEDGDHMLSRDDIIEAAIKVVEGEKK